MDSDQEILFVPSGEIFIISLYNLGVLIGSDKNPHVSYNEKVNIKKINNYWTIEDSKREQFQRIMFWSGMNS